MMPSTRRKISPVVISTALGQAGRGIFPYTLLPGYRRLLQVVRETGATVFTKSATRFPRRGNFVPANPLTWKYLEPEIKLDPFYVTPASFSVLLAAAAAARHAAGDGGPLLVS